MKRNHKGIIEFGTKMTLRGSAVPQEQGGLVPVAVYDDGELRQAEDAPPEVYARLKRALDSGALKNLTVYAVPKEKLTVRPYEGPEQIGDGTGRIYGATIL